MKRTVVLREADRGYEIVNTQAKCSGEDRFEGITRHGGTMALFDIHMRWLSKASLGTGFKAIRLLMCTGGCFVRFVISSTYFCSGIPAQESLSYCSTLVRVGQLLQSPCRFSVCFHVHLPASETSAHQKPQRVSVKDTFFEAKAYAAEKYSHSSTN